MSHSQLFYLQADGLLYGDSVKYKNAHGTGPFIWSELCRKYTTQLKSFSRTTPFMPIVMDWEHLVKYHKQLPLTWYEHNALAFTFDYVLIKSSQFGLLADSLEAFLDAYKDDIGKYVCHWQAIALNIRNHDEWTESKGVGIWLTDVSQNPWEMSDGPDKVRNYDITRDTKHTFYNLRSPIDASQPETEPKRDEPTAGVDKSETDNQSTGESGGAPEQGAAQAEEYRPRKKAGPGESRVTSDSFLMKLRAVRDAYKTAPKFQVIANTEVMWADVCQHLFLSVLSAPEDGKLDAANAGIAFINQIITHLYGNQGGGWLPNIETTLDVCGHLRSLQVDATTEHLAKAVAECNCSFCGMAHVAFQMCVEPTDDVVRQRWEKLMQGMVQSGNNNPDAKLSRLSYNPGPIGKA